MDNKHKYMSFRVTQKEKLALEMLARTENRNISDTMRLCLREALDRRGWPAIGLLDTLAEWPEALQHEPA